MYSMFARPVFYTAEENMVNKNLKILFMNNISV